MALERTLRAVRILEKTQRLERFVATNMLPIVSDRIFNRGEASDNNQIGNYTQGYIKRRVKEGWSASKKVILQFTRQMVNDFSMITGGRVVGLGFKNQANADKSTWNEDTYDKAIFRHTPQEIKQVGRLVQTFVNRILNGTNP